MSTSLRVLGVASPLIVCRSLMTSRLSTRRQHGGRRSKMAAWRHRPVAQHPPPSCGRFRTPGARGLSTRWKVLTNFTQWRYVTVQLLVIKCFWQSHWLLCCGDKAQNWGKNIEQKIDEHDIMSESSNSLHLAIKKSIVINYASSIRFVDCSFAQNQNRL